MHKAAHATRDMTRKRILLIAAVLAVLAVSFVVLRPRGQSSTSAPVAREKGGERGGGAALPVYTEKVQSRTLQERITATGAIVADESIELVSEVSGKVVSISFEEGSLVKAGDVLLKIDDTELAAQAARAESRVALARAQAGRQNQLVAAGGTSREALDVAESEVSVLESEVRLARAQLAKTDIRAPFDGVVGLRHVSVGAFINSSARIATLQKIDTIKVEFSVAERHLDRVRTGAEVRITVAGIAEPFSGTVYAIEPRIDPATRTLSLRARAANPGSLMLPGGFATVELPLREIPNALLVPASAIITGLNDQQVYVLENGKAQPRKVQTGLRLARDIQILSGLEPGATVITSGQLQLRPGVSVEPVTPAEGATAEPRPAAPKADTAAAP